MSTPAVRILSFLSEQEEARYGLEIARGANVGVGRLYPALARLERDGYIIGEWGEPPKRGMRRRRKYYHATYKGVSAAKGER